MENKHSVIEWNLWFKNLSVKLIDLSHVLSSSKFLNQNAHKIFSWEALQEHSTCKMLV
jgi:hypothetical protein